MDAVYNKTEINPTTNVGPCIESPRRSFIDFNTLVTNTVYNPSPSRQLVSVELGSLTVSAPDVLSSPVLTLTNDFISPIQDVLGFTSGAVHSPDVLLASDPHLQDAVLVNPSVVAVGPGGWEPVNVVNQESSDDTGSDTDSVSDESPDNMDVVNYDATEDHYVENSNSGAPVSDLVRPTELQAEPVFQETYYAVFLSLLEDPLFDFNFFES